MSKIVWDFLSEILHNMFITILYLYNNLLIQTEIYNENKLYYYLLLQISYYNTL